ncbi:MAG: outer membrane beta-barrel protein [Bacteroidales bacterium]|jgi:hypothetical protein|nr:outer membrane beta-barrel protein [Bacteroidales bacterium]
MKKNNRKWMLWGSFLILFYSMNYTAFGQQDTLVFRMFDPYHKHKEKKCSIHTIIGGGFILPPKDNTNYRIRYGNSVQGLLGLQFKAKLAKFYIIGIDLALSGNHYEIRQDKDKWFIDTNNYQKETFATGDISLAFTHKFKLNKGAFETWALEASAFGSYVYSGKHKTIMVDYNPEDIYAGKIRTKTIYRKLSYLEHWIWGLQLRLTYHGIGIYAQYRMNNLVKLGRPVDYPSFDMPRLSIGLVFSGDVFNF